MVDGPMFFSRLKLRKECLSTGALQHLAENIYRQHKLIWKLFQGESHRVIKTKVEGVEKDVVVSDFLFRQENGYSMPSFYVVSHRLPNDDEAIWDIRSREYEPKLKDTDRLQFTLRANPVVTKKTPQLEENSKKRQRHDVVMEAKRRIPMEERPYELDLVRDAGLRWLGERSQKHGFTFDPTSIRVDSYRQHRFFRRGCDPVQLSTLDFNGVLTVNDPDRFLKVLYNGMGPAKAFGCGLLLVRRG